MENTAILILAAGGSTRMGKPKLAEKTSDKSLITRIIDETTDLKTSSRLIIVGGHKEIYLPLISDYDNLEIIVNPNWSEGVSTSLKAGIKHIMDIPGKKTDGVLILLADMVRVNSEYLKLIIREASESGKGIVASDYGPSLGPPIIFGRKYFQELMELEGDKGAKSIILNHRDDLIALDFPDGLIDIDTPEDLKRLRSRE